MNSRKRMVLAVSLLVAMLMISTLGMATATTFRHGSIRVQISSDHPGGDNINLVVPATLAEAAIALAPVGLLRDEIPMGEIAPFLPAIPALARELEDLPDAIYVEVSGPNETVRIEKKDGRFIIDVNDRYQTVHVSIPVTTVNRAIRKAQRLV